jgi:hypothetical protein
VTILDERTVRGEIVEELGEAHELHKDAEAAYIAQLAQLGLDMTTLKGGRHGFDFMVEVPSAKLHAITQRIVDVEFAVADEYGIRFSTFAIAV